MQRCKVMIIDSTPFSAKRIEKILIDNGLEVIARVSEKSEMLDQFIFQKPDVVLMNLTMPEIDGFEGIDILRSIDDDFKSIIFGPVKMEEELFNEIEKYRIDGYLQRPLKEDKIIEIIKNVIERE